MVNHEIQASVSVELVLLLRSRFVFVLLRRVILSRVSDGKSQKITAFYRTAERHGDFPIHIYVNLRTQYEFKARYQRKQKGND